MEQNEWKELFKDGFNSVTVEEIVFQEKNDYNRPRTKVFRLGDQLMISSDDEVGFFKAFFVAEKMGFILTRVIHSATFTQHYSTPVNYFHAFFRLQRTSI